MAQVRSWEFVNADGDTVPLTAKWGARGHLGPTFDLTTERASGVEKAIVADYRPEPIEVDLEMHLEAAGIANYHAAARALAADLVGPGSLRVTSRDGVIRRLPDVYPLNVDAADEFIDHGTFGLVLWSASPWWEDATETVVEFNVPPATGEIAYPITYPLVVAAASAFFDQSIENDGHAEVWPVWEIDGPVDSGWSLTNERSGSSTTVANAILSGETVTVDTRDDAKSILLDGSTSLLDKLTGRLWPLLRGSQDVTIDLNGTTSGVSQVRLRYRRRWRSA